MFQQKRHSKMRSHWTKTSHCKYLSKYNTSFINIGYMIAKFHSTLCLIKKFPSTCVYTSNNNNNNNILWFHKRGLGGCGVCKPYSYLCGVERMFSINTLLKKSVFQKCVWKIQEKNLWWKYWRNEKCWQLK